MKSIVFGFAVMLLFGITRTAFGQEKPIPLGNVQEGVYFLDGTFQTTILELKDKQFRYWFRSDHKMVKEPTYPLSGTYSNHGGSISFERTVATRPKNQFNTNAVDFVQTERWEFMQYKGGVTLWTSNSLASWQEKHPHPILFPTNRKPEEIWEARKPTAPRCPLTLPLP